MFRVFEINFGRSEPVSKIGDIATASEATARVLQARATDGLIRLAYNLEDGEFASAAGGHGMDHDAIAQARKMIESSGVLVTAT